jgi:hypothetical protein
VAEVARPSLFTVLRTNVVLRVALYYAVLIAVVELLWHRLPRGELISQQSMDALFGNLPGAVSGKAALKQGITTPPLDQTALATTVGLAMISSVLLTLPVAWIYILTRAKRGYQQSVVHTLIVLPLVVAGIVVLVKYSLALAFSLAGIVAAVRFRNTLDDSKDAVYIFLSTAIGLSSAVDVPVAIVISILFNAVVLVLWYSDFGRTPTHLEGRIAKRKMQRALEAMSRTGTFVAKIDQEIFQDMTAEQLEAVADRAWRRRRRNDPEAPDMEGKKESLLRIRTYDVDGSRHALEPLLDTMLKKWRYGGVVHESDGTHVVEYTVQLKKTKSADDLLEALRSEGGPHVIGAEFN